MDTVDALAHNTQNRPVEDIELSHPIRVEEYRLRKDGLCVSSNGDSQSPNGSDPSVSETEPMGSM